MIDTVKGLKLETYIFGLGVPGYLEKVIFIPSYQLDLRQNGRVFKSERPPETNSASRVRELMRNKLHAELHRQNGHATFLSEEQKLEVLQAGANADKEATTSFEISKELVDIINDLYKKSIDGETPQNEARRLIKELIQESGIFND